MRSELTQLDPAWAWAAYEPAAEADWSIQHVAHLYRRAGFAATWEQLQAGLRQSPIALARELVEQTEAPADFQQESASLARSVLATGNPQNLAAWWLHRMLHSPCPLVEKMTLFWH